MARLTGSKNKKVVAELDHEDLFLETALQNYTFWKAKVAEMTTAGKDAVKEKAYVEAFRLQLHGFTMTETQS
jgi:hypothetical protein